MANNDATIITGATTFDGVAYLTNGITSIPDGTWDIGSGSNNTATTTLSLLQAWNGIDIPATDNLNIGYNSLTSTGNGIQISPSGIAAVGTTADINIDLTPKGTGVIIGTAQSLSGTLSVGNVGKTLVVSNTGIALGGMTANQPLILSPAGTGAIQTTSAGNARGNYAVDLQHYGGFYTTTVASGNYSFTVGESNTASGGNSIATGSYSIASGAFSFAGGSTSYASGTRSISFGDANVSAASYSVAFGKHSKSFGYSSVSTGYYTTASGSYSLASGSYCTTGYTVSSIISLSSTTITIFGNVAAQFSVGDTVLYSNNGLSPGTTTVSSSSYASSFTTLTLAAAPTVGSNQIVSTTQGKYGLAVGNTVHAYAPSTFAFGANISNTNASSIQLGFSDTTKVQIDATNGITNYSGQVNPGNSTLATGTKGLESVTYRSAITSFIATSAPSIITVPTGFMLMIKSIDYVTIAIGTAGATQAVIEVGNTSTANAYLTSYTLPTSTNLVGGNVRIINSNVCVVAGTTVNFTITTAANATSQTGVIMIEGVLIPTT